MKREELFQLAAEYLRRLDLNQRDDGCTVVVLLLHPEGDEIEAGAGVAMSKTNPIPVGAVGAVMALVAAQIGKQDPRGHACVEDAPRSVREPD